MVPIDQSWELVNTADLDGDRKFDLLWRHKGSGQLVSWFMNGLAIGGSGAVGTTVATTTMAANLGFKIEAVNDFNGDGKADLFWRNQSGEIRMWLATNQWNQYQEGSLSFQGSSLPSLELGWQIAGTDDFSGDGKADIVWRHQSLGQLSLWSMNGFQIGSQISQTVAAEVVDLARKPVGAATRPDTVDVVEMARVSDSGESQTDWITNVRQVGFAGATTAGNTISLFANNTLVGQTTASVNGAWELATVALEDGVYDLSLRTTNAAGGFTTRTFGQKLVIDTIAPELSPSNLPDGVAWDNPGTALLATLRDVDPGSKLVNHQLKNVTPITPSTPITLNPANLAIDGTTKTGNLVLKSLTDLGFKPPTDGSISTRYELELTVRDRAGNTQTQMLKGMALNLPDLTDESYMLPRSGGTTVIQGNADPTTVPLGSGVPVMPGGANQPPVPLFIGPGGTWGYARSVSGGGGTGGTGGNSITWVPVPIDNATSAGGTGGWVPPLPPRPPLEAVPDLLDYVPALELIFKTAMEVLSAHPETNAKKYVLLNAQQQLVSTGQVVQQYGLHNVMADATVPQEALLYGVYQKAYGPGGKLTKLRAVDLGWELAQALAQSTKSTKLQTFEAPLLAATHAAVQMNGGTIDPAQETTVKTTVRNLAVSYARLTPLPEQSAILEGLSVKGFLDRLWNWTPFETNRNATETIVDDALNLNDLTLQDLKSLLQGQDVIPALQFVDRLIQAATRTETLHQNVNGVSEFPRYIQYGGFLRELTELGFEIMRVKPTTTAGVNDLSEWIENLLEEGGSGTGMRLAAGGLSQLFEGFKLNQYGSYSEPAGIDQVGQALDYMGRLVQAADAVDDVNLDQEVLKASTLSHLVNLGGAYTALKPTKNGAMNFFLDTAWASQSDLPTFQQSLLTTSNELEIFLKSYSGIQPKKELELAKNTLWAISKVPSNYIQEQFASPSVLQTWIKDVLGYTNIQMSLKVGESILDPSELFEGIQKISDRRSAETVGIQLYVYLTPESIQIASADPNNLIAQESIGKEIEKGLWELAVSVFTLGYLVLNEAGRITRIIFKSSSETDNRTDDEKLTDDAIADMLKGSIPTDSQGNALKPGQARNPKEPVENYEKPEGDATTQIEDIEKLADNTGGIVEVKQSSKGVVRVVELPSGQSAGAYPTASSTGSPTTQITLRQGGRSIKIRYTKGFNRRATILIPTA